MKPVKVFLLLTNKEFRILVRALIEWRSELISDGICIDAVDDILCKITKGSVD